MHYLGFELFLVNINERNHIMYRNVLFYFVLSVLTFSPFAKEDNELTQKRSSREKGIETFNQKVPNKQRVKPSKIGELSNCREEDIPTLEQIRPASYRATFRSYSTDDALSLGISTVMFEGDISSRVIVRDFKRSETCLTTDGRFIKEYGQTVRTVISAKNYKASLGFDISLFAADATLNRAAYFVDMEVAGIYSPDLIQIISDISSLPLSVKNFDKIDGAYSKTLSLLTAKNAENSIHLLDTRPVQKEENLTDSVAIAYAVAMIGKRMSCKDAKSNYSGNERDLKIIGEVYETVVQFCNGSKPSRDDRDRAKELLKGVLVSV